MTTTKKSKNPIKRFFTWLNSSSNNNKEKLSQISFGQSGLDDTYLFDFKNWASSYNGGGGVNFQNDNDGDIGIATHPQPMMAMGSPNVTNKSAPTKIKIKPVDVLVELETIPTPFSLALLDEKIEILKDKSKLIVQHYAKREVDALIVRLQNRKKFTEHRAFFDRFDNTTDEKIDKLLAKYDLVMKTSDIFIPEFPDDAIATMKAYTEKMALICDKKPVFYVIAEPQLFKKAYEKRDPILLVQSPFGFYWQICGSWDKEMLLLSEL